MKKVLFMSMVLAFSVIGAVRVSLVAKEPLGVEAGGNGAAPKQPPAVGAASHHEIQVVAPRARSWTPYRRD